MRYVRTLDELGAVVGIRAKVLGEMRRKWGAPVEKTPEGYAVEPVEAWLVANHLPRKAYPEYHGTPYRTAGGASVSASASPLTASGPLGGDVLAAGAAATDPLAALRLKRLAGQAKETALKAELREIEVQERRASVMPIEEVKRRDIARIQVIKKQLMSWASSLPRHLMGLDEAGMEAVLKAKIRQLLEKFSQM